jgi:hypothetical protein
VPATGDVYETHEEVERLSLIIRDILEKDVKMGLPLPSEDEAAQDPLKWWVRHLLQWRTHRRSTVMTEMLQLSSHANERVALAHKEIEEKEREREREESERKERERELEEGGRDEL